MFQSEADIKCQLCVKALLAKSALLCCPRSIPISLLPISILYLPSMISLPLNDLSLKETDLLHH